MTARETYQRYFDQVDNVYKALSGLQNLMDSDEFKVMLKDPKLDLGIVYGDFEAFIEGELTVEQWV